MKFTILPLCVCLLAGCGSTRAELPVAERVIEERLSAGALQPLPYLQSIDQQTILLQQADQRKLLIFFATWCSDSQRAIKQILASELPKQSDLLIVGIGREETDASLQQFRQQYQVSFPLVADPDKALYQQFTNQGVPRIVLVDGKNRIVKTFLAEIPDVMPELVW